MKLRKRVLAVALAVLVGVGIMPQIPAKAAEEQAKTVRNFANVVVFTHFKDDGQEGFYNRKARDTDDYNAGRQIQEYYDGTYGRSMKSYLNTVSYGKFQIHNIFPQMDESGNVTPYELPYSVTEAASSNIDYNIITSVLEKAALDLNGKVVDYDGDGAVDNLTVILLGEAPSNTPNGMPSLYPHQSFYPGTAQLAGRTVRNYNLLNTQRLIGSTGGTGSLLADESALIIHEFLHSLGYPDLYRMSNTDDPVYTWDIMGQSMKYVSWPLAYMRQYFTNWITLPEYKESGKVEIAKANDAVIIRGPANPYEFFVVESRVEGASTDENTLDAGIGGTGVIVYRVDTTVSGLSNFSKKTAIYVFRPQPGQEGYSADSEKTCVRNAYLPYGQRKSIGNANQEADLADGALTYNDGTNSRIVLSDITVDPNTGAASFNVSIPDAADFDLWENTSFPSAAQVHAVSLGGKQYGAAISSDKSVRMYEYGSDGKWIARGNSQSLGTTTDLGGMKLLVQGQKVVFVCAVDTDDDWFKESVQAYEWEPNTYAWKKIATYKFTGNENECNGLDAAVMDGVLYVNALSNEYKTASLLKLGSEFELVSKYVNTTGFYGYGDAALAAGDGELYVGIRYSKGDVVSVWKYTDGGQLQEITSPGNNSGYSMELYNGTLYCAFGSGAALSVKKYDSVTGTWVDYAEKAVDSFTVVMTVAQGNLYAITRPRTSGENGKLAVYAIQESSDGTSATIEMEGSPVGIPGTGANYGLISSNENLFAYYINNNDEAVVSKKATANRLLSLTIKAPDTVTYKKGDAVSTEGMQVTANYVKSTKILGDSEYTVSGFDATTAGEKEATVSFGGVTNTFAYQVFDVVEEPPVVETIAKEVTLYPDASGNITMTEEQLKTVNNLDSSLCVTVMFKYTENPQQNKAYALFTLENDAGEFYTVWHAPDRHKQNGTTDGCVGYSYNGSKTNGYWSNALGRITEQGKWLKASCYIAKPESTGYVYTSLNGTTVANRTDGADFIDGQIFKRNYTSGHKGKSSNPVSLDVFGKPIDTGYEIRYVKISSESVDSAASLNSGVQKEVDPSVQTEYKSNRELYIGAVEEDYKTDSWTEFVTAKAGMTDFNETVAEVPENQEWTYCNYIDGMKNAISKLSVCFHNFKNGKCTECQREVQQEKKNTVTVYDGDTEIDKKTDIVQSTILSVTAEQTKDGRTFSHWSDTKDGAQKLCTDLRYNFYVTKDMTLYAIYVNAGSSVAQTPVITMSNTYSKYVDFKHRLYFEVSRHVPEGYTVMEQGVLYGVDGSVLGNAENVKVDKETGNVTNPAVLKYKGKGTANKGVLTFTIPVDGHLSEKVYARGYMIVKNNATGEKEVFYTSPMVEVTYDELSTQK